MGFAAREATLQPTIQFAFQYSAIVSMPSSAGKEPPAGKGADVAAGGGRLALQRRLRVVTLRVRVILGP